MAGEQIEELICLLASLDREALIEQFAHYPSAFPIDFTPAFLDSLSTDRLRHIFMAICIQSKRMPSMPAETLLQNVA